MDVQIHTDPHTIESASTNKTKTTKKEKCSLFFFNSGIHEFSPATKKRDIATSRRTPTPQKGIFQKPESTLLLFVSLSFSFSRSAHAHAHTKKRALIYTQREKRDGTAASFGRQRRASRTRRRRRRTRTRERCERGGAKSRSRHKKRIGDAARTRARSGSKRR
jgi:hypothetical protein